VRGEGGRPRVRIFGSGSPVEIRLFGFSPEGDTCLPVCVSHRIREITAKSQRTQRKQPRDQIVASDR
jgi:hypothetical protein